MTVKWITEVDGVSRERLFEAMNVEVCFPHTNDGHMPSGVTCGDYPVDKASLFIDPHEGHYSGYKFDCGKFYVMNESGSTVASYNLDH